jgi:uncharacterized membrane protein (UPF0127 family)
MGASLGGPALAGERIELPLQMVEMADEPAERSRGMMGRTEFCDQCAMLFVWPTEEPRSFWMKNTPLPLDLIFLNTGGKVVAVVTGMEPFREKPPYVSKKPARFALEVPAGYAARNGVREGMLVDLEALFGAVQPYAWPED